MRYFHSGAHVANHIDYQKTMVWPCEPLSPAGTGTQAVHYALNLSATRLGVTLPRHVHHTANWSASCFLMSLRDPAGRLESGMRYELLYPQYVRPRLKKFGSVTQLVRSLQNASRQAQKMLDTSRRKVIPWDDGSFFLTEQNFYLDRLPPEANVLFVCEHNLRHDLQLAMQDAHWDDSLPAAFKRRSSASAHQRTNSTLTPEDANYVRRLFAKDTALVCKECGILCDV